MTTEDDGEGMTIPVCTEETYIYAFLGVKNIDNGKWGKRNGRDGGCGGMEQEKGCRGGVLGLTGGGKCDDGGRKRLFRTARLPVWRCRTYHIAT